MLSNFKMDFDSCLTFLTAVKMCDKLSCSLCSLNITSFVTSLKHEGQTIRVKSPLTKLTFRALALRLTKGYKHSKRPLSTCLMRNFHFVQG